MFLWFNQFLSCLPFQQIGPNSMQLFRNLIAKVQTNQQAILRFIACTEVFMMPMIVFMLFS